MKKNLALSWNNEKGMQVFRFIQVTGTTPIHP